MAAAGVLQVDEIHLREVRIRLRRPFEIATGVTEARRICLLEFCHVDGLRVWSECVAGEEPDYSPETVDTAWHALTEWLMPRVLGRAFRSPAEVHDLLAASVRGHEMARAAVEMGYWALAAALAGKPLVELLGGVRDRVAAGMTLSLSWDIGQLAREAERLRGQGYQKIKLKIRPGADYERLAAVRDRLGPDVPMAADGNGSYGREDADALVRLDDLDLLMLEQPLAPDQMVGHAELQRRLRTPLCLDESLTSATRVEDALALGATRIVNLKPGRVGGLTQSLAIHGLCVERGAPLWCGGMLESGVGRAYNLALASLPGFTVPGDVYPPETYLEEGLVTPASRLESDGTVRVPRELPGIGVRVDEDRVDALTVCRTRLRAAARGSCASASTTRRS